MTDATPIPTPGTPSPLSLRLTDPEAYEREITALVNETAPRMFAVVADVIEEDGIRDGWVMSWGMQYEDGRTQVISEDGRRLMRLASAERIPFLFTQLLGGDGTARMKWVD